MLKVPVEKIKYVDKPVYVDKIVERRVEVPVEVERRVEVPVPYEKIVLAYPESAFHSTPASLSRAFLPSYEHF